MKKVYLLATALAALVSCSSDDFTGEQNLRENNNGRSISFELNTPAVTRANGASAATLLNNNFVVFGYKSTNTTVFNNYQVNWETNTAGSTESNSANWEYVSYKNLPNGVGTNVGVTAFSTTTTGSPNNSTAVDQSIKYWDFSAGTYDFFGYSLGTGTGGVSPTYARASAMSASTYTLTGTQTELGACYISKKKHITDLSSTKSTAVQLEFVNFLSKIQLKFFETIPGYSVKNLKFYIASDTKSTGSADNDGLAPAFYSTSTIPTAGTYTITFDEAYDPVVTLTEATTSVNNITFPAAVTDPSTAWLDNYAAQDYKETAENVYLGRTANTATASKQIDVLPNSTGADLTLKMDYTLLSRDGSGETIQVTGATATVPAAYTKWKSNYAYTYIFKISDNTNGQIGSETGLYPITLDAIVTETENGSQTTITTVATPSITTYQSGAIADEYSAGNIYVVVGDGTTVLTAETNAKLYTATIETGAAQGIAGDGSVAITEEMVANALTKTLTDGKYTLTDANNKKLTVTPVSSEAADKLVGGLTEIPAADAPGGKALAVKCASFAAVNNTVYVFEYIYDTDKKAYKVIKVGTPTAVTP